MSTKTIYALAVAPFNCRLRKVCTTFKWTPCVEAVKTTQKWSKSWSRKLFKTWINVKPEYCAATSILNQQKYSVQKQLSRGVFRKRCFENMQQIYRRKPMPKVWNDLRDDYWEIPLISILACFKLFFSIMMIKYLLIKKTLQRHCIFEVLYYRFHHLY